MISSQSAGAVSAGALSPRTEVLRADNLRKSYGQRAALHGLSFSLHAGRILGFLGPNGAGKTTAIRILTTILEPTSGEFVVDGVRSTHPETIRGKIGVLPESQGFPRQMTGIECLTFFGQLYGRPRGAARANGQALLREVGLERRATSLIGTYSRGMRQRLGIARSLVNDPVVVFLDEPTLGLDPRGQQELLTLIRRVASDHRVGVILCSHALSEIESICDDVVIMNAGQIVATGTVADVIGQVQSNALRRNVLRVQVPAASLAHAQQVMESLPHVVASTKSGETTGWLRVELTRVADDTPSGDPRNNNAILEALIRAEVPILSFEAEGSRLQDAFFQLTEEAHA